MTKEDIEFLRDLQQELNTQPNDGNADPVFWGIIEKEKLYVANGDDIEILVDGETSYSLKEFIDLLEEDKEVWSAEVKKAWERVDTDDADDVCDFASDILGMWVSVNCYEERDKLAENRFFLTKRSAKAYIDKYSYKHNSPRTYAQTAVMNPEFDHLLKILKTMDIYKLVADE